MGGASVTAPRSGAIGTTYQGFRFRSRIEARWAVFFDALGVPWEHEPEGYSDGATHYLPDFWLPDQQTFWEVKASKDFDEKKAIMLAQETMRQVVVSFHQPWETYQGHDVDGATLYWPIGECAFYWPYSLERLERVGWRSCAYCKRIELNWQDEGEAFSHICRSCSAPPDLDGKDWAVLPVTRAVEACKAYQFWIPPEGGR